jgi:oxygen-independent coproporphyrinogen-3 oxidase
VAQGIVQNHTAEIDWRRGIERGAPPVARGHAFSDDDRFYGEIIERLMCDLAVDLGVICRRHQKRLSELASALESLGQMQGDGLLVVADGHLAMTDLGAPFVRAACAAFDPYLLPSAQRHAAAI